MSDVSVSVRLTPKQQGALYMQNMKRGDRIKQMRDGLKRIVALAEESENWSIATAAKALLEEK